MVRGWMQQKRRYRRYRARADALPAGHQAAVDALQRYMQYFGPGRANDLLPMLEDLVDLFGQSAADGTPIREVVGEDPLEFADAFLRNYPQGQWISRERERLIGELDRAATAGG